MFVLSLKYKIDVCLKRKIIVCFEFSFKASARSCFRFQNAVWLYYSLYSFVCAFLCRPPRRNAPPWLQLWSLLGSSKCPSDLEEEEEEEEEEESLFRGRGGGGGGGGKFIQS